MTAAARRPFGKGAFGCTADTGRVREVTMRRKLPCEIDCGGTPPLWQGSLFHRGHTESRRWRRQGRSSRWVGLLVGLLALAVFQYAFVLNASLDLPAWAILKNSRALTFLGLKYTIGILGITCFVDAALLFGFPISLVLLVLGFPTLVQFIVCCLGNIPMQKWIVEPYLRQQEENAET